MEEDNGLSCDTATLPNAPWEAWTHTQWDEKTGSNGPRERTSKSWKSCRQSQSTLDLSFLSPRDERKSGGESRRERVGWRELEIGVLKRCKNENPGERPRFQLICISNEEWERKRDRCDESKWRETQWKRNIEREQTAEQQSEREIVYSLHLPPNRK